MQVQDAHVKDKQTLEEIETQMKKVADEKGVLAEQILREQEMAAEADDVSPSTCCCCSSTCLITYLRSPAFHSIRVQSPDPQTQLCSFTFEFGALFFKYKSAKWVPAPHSKECG